MVIIYLKTGSGSQGHWTDRSKTAVPLFKILWNNDLFTLEIISDQYGSASILFCKLRAITK